MHKIFLSIVFSFLMISVSEAQIPPSPGGPGGGWVIETREQEITVNNWLGIDEADAYLNAHEELVSRRNELLDAFNEVDTNPDHEWFHMPTDVLVDVEWTPMSTGAYLCTLTHRCKFGFWRPLNPNN